MSGPCVGLDYRRELGDGRSVAIAKVWNYPQLVPMAQAHAAEVWPDGKRLAAGFVDFARREYERGYMVPIGAFEGDGLLIGYNVLGYQVNPLTQEPMLGDYGLYVAPEHRRGGIALALLEAQKEIARRLRVRECYAGYVSCEAHGLQRLYEAAGFRKAMIGFSWRGN